LGTEIEWDLWRKLRQAPLWQHVALMAGLDPERDVTCDGVLEEIRPLGGIVLGIPTLPGPTLDEWDEFTKFLAIATSHLGSPGLEAASFNYSNPALSVVETSKFWTWAIEEALPVPEPLRDLAAVDPPEPAPKRMKTLYKTILGLAMKHHSYRGPQAKTDAAVTIAQTLELMGVSLSDDAVRDCLRDAWNALKPDERPKPTK
jgi:hypothetical protein